MSPVHQVLPKPSCKAQWKAEEDKADKGRGGETTSGNGQAWSSASPRGQWRIGKNGENWLQNHLWCPNDPCGSGIDDDDDDVYVCGNSDRYLGPPSERERWHRDETWPCNESYMILAVNEGNREQEWCDVAYGIEQQTWQLHSASPGAYQWNSWVHLASKELQ